MIMRIASLALILVLATTTLMQTPRIFANSIDIHTIQELYETIYKVQDLQLQQELLEQIKNIVYELDLEIPNNN